MNLYFSFENPFTFHTIKNTACFTKYIFMKNQKIEQQLQLLKERWFEITDQEKILWYLEKVGYHRLAPYFRNANGNIDRVISFYLFDKRLRLLSLDMLEVIENAIKSIIINYIFPDPKENNRYINSDIYISETYDERIKFIKYKTAERKVVDPIVKRFFKNNPKEKYLPDYIFFEKLTFGEIRQIFKDLKIEYKKEISDYFWINGFMFEDWIFALKYFRNLCSHYENIFNKTMTISIRSKIIATELWTQNTFIAYFALLSVFNKLLIPNFDRQNKVIELMKKFRISTIDIWDKQKNLPSELESEAWEVLVNSLYEKHIKKSNLFINEIDQ